MNDQAPPPYDRGFADSTLVDRLDVESLERAKIHRLQIELSQDGLSVPIRVPVLVARGRRSGPVFGLTAAIHGNELNGIPVIHQLFTGLAHWRLKGTVAAVVVANVPAYNAERRRFPDGTDLNHIFPGKPEGNVAEVYAFRLFDRVVKQFDFLVDLHTASFGRINSLYVRADMTHPLTARMAYLQRPQIIVHNPASDHTLRGSAMELGIPSITMEVGNPQLFQRSYIRRSLTGLRALLSEVGMLAKRPLALGKKPPVLCERSYWIYTDHGGILEVAPDVVDEVSAGQEIAKLVNVFGDTVRTYAAPEDGIVIGKSVNPVGQAGARILHLGIKAAGATRRYHHRTPISPPHRG